MIWIPVLAIPAALAMFRLGAALTVVSTLKSAVLVLLVLLAAALVWAMSRRRPKT